MSYGAFVEGGRAGRNIQARGQKTPNNKMNMFDKQMVSEVVSTVIFRQK
jgi:hypothetical protein